MSSFSKRPWTRAEQALGAESQDGETTVRGTTFLQKSDQKGPGR